MFNKLMKLIGDSYNCMYDRLMHLWKGATSKKVVIAALAILFLGLPTNCILGIIALILILNTVEKCMYIHKEFKAVEFKKRK